MLIEYKIRFEQDGVTITQRVEPDSAPGTADPAGSNGIAAQNSLGSSFPASQGGAGNLNAGPGGAGNLNAGPGGAGNLNTGPGGAGNLNSGPGGSGAGTPVIVFGPIIIGASAAAGNVDVPQQATKAVAAAAPATSGN